MGGTFTLTFRGETTGPVAFDAVPSNLETALEMLRSIGQVTVVGDTASSPLCSGGGSATVITFETELANVPLVTTTTTTLTKSGGSATAIIATTTGGKGIILECGGKGICDKPSGTCKCWDGWTSSDGFGAHGQRGDCGFSSIQ